MFNLCFEKLGDHVKGEDELVDDEEEEGNSSARVMSEPERHVDAEETQETSKTEDDDDDEEAVLRRSTRARRKPYYLSEYISLAEIECERLLITINEEPWDFEEAKAHREWVVACEDEIESIVKNKTWDLVDLPLGAKTIRLKWVFKIKRNPDGSIIKFKARLVAKGYVQRHGIDYDEVFAPVAQIETIRFILSLAATNHWEVHHLDVKTAFLHGELKEEVYVRQPEGFEVNGREDKVYKLNKVLYRLKQAPRAWNIKINNII